MLFMRFLCVHTNIDVAVAQALHNIITFNLCNTHCMFDVYTLECPKCILVKAFQVFKYDFVY